MEVDSQSEYKQILIENMVGWEHTSSISSIELKKLTGLTNATYLATNNEVEGPNKVVIRIFGSVEGLVDKKKEHLIFNELGKMGQGPRCLAYGGSWRIEEFIDSGSHPTLANMRERTYRRLIAKYLSQFHQVELKEIPRETASIDKYLNNSAETFKPFFEKVKQGATLFSESELAVLQELASVATQEEVSYLKSILPQSETKLCHNDLNNLNIFLSFEGQKKIKFIDFEYCGYNFIAFDIANFMNESHFDYQVAADPYYRIVQENVFEDKHIADFAAVYLISKELNEEQLQQFEDVIMKDQDDPAVIEEFAQKSGIDQQAFQLKRDELEKEIIACQILSNWYWILWSVITAKAPGMLFNHLHYAKARLDIYSNLKLKLTDKLKR